MKPPPLVPLARGRPKGAPSKATKQGREAIAAFVEGNAWRLERWLDAIAKNSPKDAFNAFMSVCEFHLPKQARVEHTGKDGVDLYPQLSDEQMLGRLQDLMNLARSGKQQDIPLALPVVIEQLPVPDIEELDTQEDANEEYIDPMSVKAVRLQYNEPKPKSLNQILLEREQQTSKKV